jgi:Tfp pilus assembly protein PilX
MEIKNERGMALIVALFLMSALSVLAASLMFLAQTETYSSMNYRMMSQARYAAESGIQKASNFLLDSAQYAIPGPGNPADPLANYNRTVSPVTYNNLPVILSATAAQASNYPVAAVQAAFTAAAQGSLTAANQTLNYKTYATLMAMQLFDSYGGGQMVVQTWQITADGTLTGSRNATVEVVGMIETPKVPASSYAAFATANVCGALNFGGNVTIDSYDSTGMSGATTPTMATTGGNVGTNGNLTIGGSVLVDGNLYTPRTGVGACTAGAVDALTESGHADMNGDPSCVATPANCIVQLPAPVSYPTPTIPAPSAVALADISNTTGGCALLGLTVSNCTEDTASKTLIIDGHGATLSLPEVSLRGQVNITLVAGTPAAQYNFNSLTIASQSQINAQATSSAQGVNVEIVGKTNAGVDIASPLDMTGGSFAAPVCPACSTYDASLIQFIYGGTGNISMKGNSGAAATFYAPNASATFAGTSDLYGSLLAKTINETGSGNIHYDRRLQHDFYVAGHPMAGTFTWKRF